MEQVRPFLGIGDVVALGIAVLAEVVGDLDVQGAIGIGEAFELDVELLAHDAAGALAADQIGAGNRFGFARRIGHLRHHAVGVLGERGEGRGEPQIDVRVRLGELERFLDDLDALALQHIRKAGVVLEMAVVELGDQLVVLRDRSSETAAR